MRIFDAIWAFRYHGVASPAPRGRALRHQPQDLRLGLPVVGIILILCGLAVIAGSQIGRWVGIAAGAIAAISAIWWMPYYPIWSLTYIALGVIVIYALAAYGAPAEVTLSPQELSRI